MCSLSSSSLVRLYLIIDYSLLTYFHSFISHHSYQYQSSLRNPFNSFKDFPRPPPAGFPSSAGLMLVPRPPGVG